MKNILTAGLLSFFVLHSSAQLMLKNTQWKGQVMGFELKLDFKEDTIYMYRNMTGPTDMFAFSQSNDTLILTKIRGSGVCPINSKGIYRIETLEYGEKFHFRLINEECPARGGAFTTNPFEKMH